MTNVYCKTIFTFTPVRRLTFCPVTFIVSLALANGVFEAENMTSLRQVLSARTRRSLNYRILLERRVAEATYVPSMRPLGDLEGRALTAPQAERRHGPAVAGL